MSATPSVQTKAPLTPWIGSAFLFGYDFFISFTLGTPPRGAQSYASDLARRLREADFTVFFSEDEAAPGSELDPTIRRALERSRVLVVVANDAALTESIWIRDEVKIFRAHGPGRPVIPISVDQALERLDPEVQPWLQHRRHIWLNESRVAVAQGIASQETVQRLVITPRSMKANTRLRITRRMLAVVLLGLTGLAWLNANRAERQRAVAESHLDDALIGYLDLGSLKVSDGNLVGAEENYDYFFRLATSLPPEKNPAAALLWGTFARKVFDLGESYRVAGNLRGAKRCYATSRKLLTILLSIAEEKAPAEDWEELRSSVQEIGEPGQIYVLTEGDEGTTKVNEWRQLQATIAEREQGLPRLEEL
jgi:hypothetical protein